MAEGKDKNIEFENQVFAAELEEIRHRRVKVAEQQEMEPELPPVGSKPDAELGLVGLSLSGGGIRSATFCLGVIQFLGSRGIINSVDYLSTVSGGGYIGSCLSSVLNRKQQATGDGGVPLCCERGKREPLSLTHLRNSGKYLVSDEILDKVRLPTLLLRGMLINLFLLIPYVILAVLVTEVLYEYAYQYQLHVDLLVQGSRGLAALMLILFVVMTLTYSATARLFRPWLSWSRRNAYERLFARSLLLALSFFIFLLVFMIVGEAVDHSWDEVLDWLHSSISPQLSNSWKWIVVAVIIVAFMSVGKASDAVSQWKARIFLYGLGIIAPAFLLVMYLLLCVWQIDSPYIGKKLTFSVDLANVEVLNAGPVSEELRVIFNGQGRLLSTSVMVEELGGHKTLIDGENAYLFMPTEQATEVYLSDTERLKVVFDSTSSIEAATNGRLKIDPFYANIFDRGGGYLYSAGIALFLLNLLFVNVNITSIHGFYRDRLSKAYLFQTKDDGSVFANDGQLLSELNKQDSIAPYHLLNVALNLQNSKDENLRGRNADFFIFSKRFIGSPRTGFVSTKVMEKIDTGVNLGTACAISGAAAAPNMGAATIKTLVPLLTLLNIRLGYWLPHPKSAGDASWWTRQRLRVGAGPAYLWKEARAKLDAYGQFVNVSDGGHIENLGIYELLRRRCKYIIAADAEADPAMRFGGLLTLIRYAQIDMGIDIEVDLNDIRRGDNGYSAQHGAVCTIHYGDDSIGYLVYIKSSLTGDEEYVRDYHAQNPRFPHEPTSDQFFSEVQFEVYRWLGHHAAEQMFNKGTGSGLDLLRSAVQVKG